MPGGVIDLDMPQIQFLDTENIKMFIHKMNRGSIDIPENEKNRRQLDMFPTRFPYEVALPEPIFEAPHGNDEKNVSHLVCE